MYCSIGAVAAAATAAAAGPEEGSRQALRPRPLTIAGQLDCKQRWIYIVFHRTEATSELCLLLVSYERLASILVLGC